MGMLGVRLRIIERPLYLRAQTRIVGFFEHLLDLLADRGGYFISCQRAHRRFLDAVAQFGLEHENLLYGEINRYIRVVRRKC